MVKEVKNLVEAEEESASESKDYVLGVFKDMFEHYKEKFSKDGMSDTDIAEKFDNNILPGFFDFAINSEHKFGSVVQPDLSNYIAIPHGCWLNTIDFMNKYPSDNFNLAMGFIVHKDDLAKIEKDIKAGFIPVYVDLIPHGFIVDNDGDVFDPTLGDNEDYHYFYQIVPEEIWKSFKYFYNSSRDWWVADFADWTKSQIRAAKETHEFYKYVGIEEVSSEDNEDVTEDENETIKVEVRNDRGELVDFEDTVVSEEESHRDEKGVNASFVASEEEPEETNNSVFDQPVEPLGLNNLFDSVQESVLKEADEADEDEDKEDINDINRIMEGDVGLDDNIPSDEVFEKRVDEYIAYCDKTERIVTKSGHLFKKSEVGDDRDASKSASGRTGEVSAYKSIFVGKNEFFVPTAKSDFINAQIDNYGNLLKEKFLKAVDEADSIQNSTTTMAVQGIGTFDSAAKTYFPFAKGEKTSYSLDAMGVDDTIPFYMTYFVSYLDNSGEIIPYNENNKPSYIIRTLSIVQPRPIYQYRTQVPNASMFNRHSRYDTASGKEVEGPEKKFVSNDIEATGLKDIHTNLLIIVCKKENLDKVVSLLGESNSKPYNIEEREGLNVIYSFVINDEDINNFVSAATELGKENNDIFVVRMNKFFKTSNMKEFKQKPKAANYEVLIDGYFTEEGSEKPIELRFEPTNFSGLYIAAYNNVSEKTLSGDKQGVQLDTDSPIPLSKTLSLYRLHNGAKDDDYKLWLQNVDANESEQKNIFLASFDINYVCSPKAVQNTLDYYMGQPQTKDYDIKSAKDFHTFQWLQREFDTQKRRLEYDEQIHRMKSACDEERMIPGFTAYFTEEPQPFSEGLLGKHKEWIKAHLCNTDAWHSLNSSQTELGLLEQLFNHYKIPLNIKLRYYMEALERIQSAGETVLVARQYDGIVDVKSVEKVGSTVNFNTLDNFIASSISQSLSIAAGENPEKGSLSWLLKNQTKVVSEERVKHNADIVDKATDLLIDRIRKDKNITGGVKYYVKKGETGAISIWQGFGNAKQPAKSKTSYINRAFIDIDSNKPVYCFKDNYGDVQIKPVDEYIEQQKEILSEVKACYEKGERGLFVDIAKVVQFGFNNECYKNGNWIKEAKKDGIINTLAPIAFGTGDYNSIVERLNAYFRLPISFLPATATSGDLSVLSAKLNDCMSIMQEFYNKFNDKEYHMYLVDKKSEDEEDTYEVNNQSYYDELYSKGKFNKESNSYNEMIPNQEEKWNKLCRYINVDIYPLVMEDEYNQLREAAKEQRKLYARARMTTKMKDISTRIVNVPWNFTTKSILFTAMKTYNSVKNLSNEFKDMYDMIANDGYSGPSDLSWLGDSFDYNEKLDLKNNIKTSGAFKSAGKNMINVFIRNMDKLKNDSGYWFLNKLIYQNLKDEEIWNLRDDICEGFGLPKITTENIDDGTIKKGSFVATVRQFINNYQGYKIGRSVSLSKKLQNNQYTLRDLNTYYRGEINDILSGLSAFVHDIKENMNDDNKTYTESFLKNMFVLTSSKVKDKETRIKAMEDIIASKDFLKEKYTWLLSQFNDLSNLYSDYKETKSELNKFIKDEIESQGLYDVDDEGNKKDIIIHRENENVGRTFSFNLSKVSEQLCKDIFSTWSVSMFDGFKKKTAGAEHKEHDLEDSSSGKNSYPFANVTSKNDPKFLQSWFSLFKPEGDKKSKLKGLFETLKKNEENIDLCRQLTLGQLTMVVDKAYEDDNEFSDAMKLFKRINDLQSIAEDNNIISFSSVGKEQNKTHEVSKVNQELKYSDDIAANLAKKPFVDPKDAVNPESWIKKVTDATDEEKARIAEMVRYVANELGGNLLVNIKSDVLIKSLELASEGKVDAAEYLVLKSFGKDVSQFTVSTEKNEDGKEITVVRKKEDNFEFDFE